MLVVFSQKSTLEVNVVADRNPVFVMLSDGSIRNGYTLHILNKRYQTRTYSVSIEGPPGARLAVVGQEREAQPKIEVTPDNLKSVRLFVTVPEATKFDKGLAKLTFIVRDLSDSTVTRRSTNFRGPEE
jgi:polyferredoxin